MIVVDASVFIHIIVETGNSSELFDILGQHTDWLAPEIVDLEVLNGIRKPLLRGELTERRALEAIEAFAQFRIARMAAHQFQNEIWKLRPNLTPYDASYVVLAKAFEVPLLTRDKPLFESSKQFVDCRLI